MFLTTKKSIRVLIVTGSYPTEKFPHNGTFIKSQIDSLIEAGIEVEVIHPKPGPALLRYLSAAIQVFFKSLNGHFDVVHGHYGQWCLIACMQWTSPVIASFLGSDLAESCINDDRFRSIDAWVVRMSRWLAPRVNATIVKSEWMKKNLTGKNIFVIPNGVDFNLFHPIPRPEARAALKWDQNRYYILFAGDPRRIEKNFSLAQAAVECLNTRGISAELVVADRLPQTALVQFINASNALILSSMYEGSPNVLKEAMACNVPVVATNVGDVNQLIGRTKGCKVCPHDPAVLAEALEEALLQEEPTTGRADIMHLNRDMIAKQIIAVYKHVKDRKARGEEKPWEQTSKY
jgi:teichuronic acid biosynthesis glycosyltransferase TuaC